MSNRPAFLDQSPPLGYIAGVGRGATGFATRGGNPSNGRIPIRLQQKQKNQSLADENKADESDEEAEDIFSAIEQKLSSRNKRKTGAKNKMHKEQKDPIADIPNQFSDLKRSLTKVTADQWLNIPEATDTTRYNKRTRMEEQQNRKTYAAPDALISQAVNLTKLTEEREKLLGRKLDEGFMEVNNKTEAEQNALLNELEVLMEGDIGEDARPNEDTKRTRMILQSYRKSEPKRPDGWIASARLEERIRNFKQARSIIEEGCNICPRSDELWLENIRLNSSNIQHCKVLIATAIRFNSKSESLWLKAVELESETFNKYRVVRKALQAIPYNEKLWQMACNLEQSKTCLLYTSRCV